jgi:hypothetical protein
MAKKITHDITCDTCGKPATLNLCNVWELYPINEKGDYEKKTDSWEGESGIDLCDKCYKNNKY